MGWDHPLVVESVLISSEDLRKDLVESRLSLVLPNESRVMSFGCPGCLAHPIHSVSELQIFQLQVKTLLASLSSCTIIFFISCFPKDVFSVMNCTWSLADGSSAVAAPVLVEPQALCTVRLQPMITKLRLATDEKTEMFSSH